MLPERLQTTLNKENVPFNVNSLCNLGPMQCCSARGSKQHFTGKNSGNSGNVVCTTSGHALYIYIYQVFHVKKICKVISSSIFYPAIGQTFSQTLSKKVSLSLSHAMLLKPMQSWLGFRKASGPRLHNGTLNGTIQWKASIQ